MKIFYGFFRSPFGVCLIGIAERKICNLAFSGRASEMNAVRIISDTWPDAKIVRNDAHVGLYAKKIFGKNGGPVAITLNGTDFQIKVWKTLLTIPKGGTKSYKDIAEAIGSPRAVRAVGTACGKNSVGFLVPCHRVITSRGKIGSYRWGAKIKKKIILWEQKN